MVERAPRRRRRVFRAEITHTHVSRSSASPRRVSARVNASRLSHDARMVALGVFRQLNQRGVVRTHVEAHCPCEKISTCCDGLWFRLRVLEQESFKALEVKQRPAIKSANTKTVLETLARVRCVTHLSSGSLLGIFRDNEWIPSDSDVDIAAYDCNSNIQSRSPCFT